MNARPLAAAILLTALFAACGNSTAQALPPASTVPLVEYKVVVDLRIGWYDWGGRLHIVENSYVLLRTTSKTEADDLAEAVYMTSQIQPQEAEEMVEELLGFPPYLMIRVEGVDVETVNNWDVGPINGNLTP